jgi:putative tryptophan/tyrosine transport system substrate-binding protein
MRRREFIAGIGSAAAAAPLAARAQQRPVPVIGYLTDAAESATSSYIAAFRQGLREQNYVEGRNVEILYRFADAHNDRLSAFAADLVRRQVAVIAAFGAPAVALAAKSATTTIPIVFSTGGDPVATGLVASLNRPGGNATGTTPLVQELNAKRLELLHELVPNVTLIGSIQDPRLPGTESRIRELENAARVLGVRLMVVDATTPGEIEKSFEALIQRGIGALAMGGSSLALNDRDQLVALASRHGVPAIYFAREFVDAGGLVSYGASIADSTRLAATYVGRVLKGEKPADLPVQRSTRIEMVLNLKTAKALGIEVPAATLLRADEVIE